MRTLRDLRQILLIAVAILLAGSGCTGPPEQNRSAALDVPEGYVSRLEVHVGDRLYGFGPFVGYYFSPVNPDDLTQLNFVCYNENLFYTRDLPQNTLLFSGDALLTKLSDMGFPLPSEDRINPVFFADVPPAWVNSRPHPQEQYRHFHSCYDALGPVRTGYWLRHKGEAPFTYDMGGRVGPDSPLYHEVNSGIDDQFATIMEFDTGPDPAGH